MSQIGAAVRMGLVRAALPAVRAAERTVGGPVVLLVLDPGDPATRAKFPEIAAAYRATPGPMRGSVVSVTAADGSSSFVVDAANNSVFTCEDLPQRDEVPPSSSCG